MPGYKSVAVDSMGRVIGDDAEVAGQPGDTLVTTIDAKVQGVVEQRARHDHRDRAADLRRGHAPQLPRRLRCRRGDGGEDRADRRDGQPADVRPRGVGRRHQQQAARPALLRQGRDAAARPGDPGPVRPGLDVEADHDRRCAQQRLHPGDPPRLLVRAAGRQPLVQELRVRVRTATSASTRRCSSPATRSSTGSGCYFWQQVRLGPDERRRQGPAGPGGEGLRLRQRDRHRPARRGQRPDRRPALEARLLEVDEGLLLQGRQRRQRQERLPARVRPRVLPRGQLLPGRRRGELRDRPGRHHRHAAPAGPRLRRALQRRHALRAADRQGDRQPRRHRAQAGSRRRWPARSTRRRPA